MFYWSMLLLAIITEVLGTSTMKFVSNSYPVQGYSFLFLTIGLSYFFLSKAIMRIPLGLAYAVWEGVGIAVITIIGYYVFKESMNARKLVGMVTIISGICMLKSGLVPNEREK